MKDAIWITWESQRRNRELSSALGVRLYEYADIDAMEGRGGKYLKGLARTMRLISREGPSLVFCQNPSLVLASYLVSMKKPAGFKVCVDAHNAGLFPREGRSSPLMAVSRYVQRFADLTIVTNEGLAAHVRKNGGRPFILPDRIPAVPDTGRVELQGRFNLLFICSYAEDEPCELVFEAARGLGDVCIYVTGNCSKKGICREGLPPNVVLTGYLPEDLYFRMLNSVDGTIDLTTRQDCLVCGAYESVGAHKPQILSDTSALRGCFHKGAVYTGHSVEALRDAIRELRERAGTLQDEARELKRELVARWELQKAALMVHLEELVFDSVREGA
jgi:hypothetical protein